MSDISSAFGSEPSLPVGEQVYRVVREAIVSLKLLPNEAISENSLSAKLGASRTPIRQALQRLEREGLVVIRPQRGSFVAALDMQVVRSAYVARLSLECAVAAEAARLRKPEDIAALEAEVAAQRAIHTNLYTDNSGFFELNQRFHNRLVEIADLKGLQHLIEAATMQLARIRVAHLSFADPYPLEPLIDQHDAIVAAVKAGDPEAAEAAMRANIQPLVSRLLLLREERPDFFETSREPGKSPWSVIDGGLNH